MATAAGAVGRRDGRRRPAETAPDPGSVTRPDRSQAAIWSRGDITRADRIAGPAIIEQADTTTLIEPGWSARLTDSGALLLEPDGHPAPVADAHDPVTLEVVRHKLEGIANEMQSTLLRSSFSPIVKEGLDASAGLFTADGSTLAQACAIPIHLRR